MDDDDIELDYNEAPLKPDQITQIEGAAAEMQNALAELGAAHVEHRDAYRVYSATTKRLKVLEEFAETARRRHDGMMTSLAKSMNLPPGEWVYDQSAGMLKKEPANG